jgi:hypothetical protein
LAFKRATPRACTSRTGVCASLWATAFLRSLEPLRLCPSDQRNPLPPRYALLASPAALTACLSQELIKFLQAALKDAQDLITANVLPPGKSWAGKAAWMLQQFKNKAKITEQFNKISVKLDRVSQDLQLGVVIDVSDGFVRCATSAACLCNSTVSTLLVAALTVCHCLSAFCSCSPCPARLLRARWTRPTCRRSWTSRARRWTSRPRR